MKLKDDSSPRPVHLTIPPELSEFSWDSRNFELLIERFLGHVLKISHPGVPVRMTVHEMMRKEDLEEFFSLYPDYWLHVKIHSQSETGLGSGAKEALESLGYRCAEWIGVEDSESQMGVFHAGAREKPALIVFVRNRGARRDCDLLIPVDRWGRLTVQPGSSGS